MLPLDVNRQDGRGGLGKAKSRSENHFPKYFRRLIDVKQMDFEKAFDEMVTLLSTEPDEV